MEDTNFYSFPTEIIQLFVLKVVEFSDAKTYLSLLLTSTEFYISLSEKEREKIKKKFLTLTKVVRTACYGLYEKEYTVLPSGKKHGLYETWSLSYEEDEKGLRKPFKSYLQRSGSFHFGKKVREWRTYYSNGSARDLTDYKNGMKEGRYKLWYRKNWTGRLKIWKKGTYKNNKKEGLWQTLNLDNNILEEGHYIDGKKEGFWKQLFDPIRNVGIKGFMLQDKRHGPWETYDFIEGKLKRKMESMTKTKQYYYGHEVTGEESYELRNTFLWELFK